MNSLPRRRSAAGLALISSERAGVRRWLARWNVAWNRFSLVGGHKRAPESFRECVSREVQEELGLKAESDFVLASNPMCRLEFNDWSERAQERTSYIWQVFAVKLVTAAAQRAVDSQPKTAWLTEQEIRDHKTRHGKHISERIALVLSLVAEGASADA